MFTGLVQAVGRVVACEPSGALLRVAVAAAPLVERMRDGESVAVDGVCLTVAARRDDRFWADVVAETLARTTLGRARPGRSVNLERSLSVGDPLGGHLVLGHVDGTVAIQEVEGRRGDRRLRLELPEPLSRYVALRGSIALDGVSLTVAGLGPDWFEVALVPETLERTTLGQARTGERLNVEVDLLARYLERLAGQRA